MASRIPSWMLLVPLVFAGFTISSAQPPSSNGPSVTVKNDASNPLFVAPAAAFAREPFFIRVDKTNVGVGVDLTVPPDKIFVIESIYVEALIGSTLERSRVALRIRPPGEEAFNAPTIQYLPIALERAGQPQIVAGGSVVRAVASLTTRLYAGPSHELLFEAPQAAADVVSAIIVASGYLVPAGAPTLAP
jgi:hypothetical protein